jgi:hypothetical protein
MTAPVPSRSELYLRFTRRSMLVVLLLVLFLGLMTLAVALWPDGVVSRSLGHASWVFPIGIILAVTALGTSQRKYRFTPDSAEVKAVMNDELRRTSMDRAMRVAFLVVLIAQMPIALLFSHSALGLGFGADLPAFRAVMAMAVSTITLGMTVFIVCFLFFDRD